MSVTVIECSRTVVRAVSAYDPDVFREIDDATFRLLHEVRLRGVVELDETETVALLLQDGLVVRSTRGIRITTEGRVTHAAWARLAPGAEAEQSARRAYERFLPLNLEMLRLCSDWQVRPGGVPNDHRDARYDWSVLDRVRDLDERIAPVMSRLGRTVERFAAYRPRLRAALERVDAGDTDWLTSPRIDSYHTVWMQMHEDLLIAIGGDRARESSSESGPTETSE
jgi:hypothetical protein